jgi:hypothetical protein
LTVFIDALASIKSGDLEGVGEHFAEDAEWETPDSLPPRDSSVCVILRTITRFSLFSWFQWLTLLVWLCSVVTPVDGGSGSPKLQLL